MELKSLTASIYNTLPVKCHHGKRRGTQVVRERSAKPLCVGSIPTRASSLPAQAGQIPHPLVIRKIARR